MKKFGLVLLLIIAFVGGIIGYRHVTSNQGYEATMTNAHNALNKQNWSDAKFYYQEAQKEKKSVEARTALDQLVYAIRADKSANKGDWQDALDWYHTAKVVDGAVDLVNENIDVAVRKVKTSRASSEAKVSSSKAASVASSKAASASIAASQSKAASEAAALSRKAAELSSSVAASVSRSSAAQSISEAFKSSKSASDSTTDSSVSDSSDTSSSDASSIPASSSSERQMDSADVAAARAELIAKGYNVQDLPASELQAAMNQVIDSHGGMTLEDIAKQHKW